MMKTISIKLLVMLVVALTVLSSCNKEIVETPKSVKLHIRYERVAVLGESNLGPMVFCYGSSGIYLQEVSPNVFEAWVDAMTEIKLTIYVKDPKLAVTLCSMEAGKKIFVNGTELYITIFTCTNTYPWAGHDEFIIRNNGSIEQ